MNPRDEIKQLWRESFDDSPEFIDMFFSRVYRDDDALTLTHDGSLVSAMLLQHYILSFHGTDAGMAYVCGAATRRARRGKGHMSTLMQAALREASDRGDTFCALIPAHSWLYPFYARFGFASVFLVNDDRYTALHPFSVEGDFHPVDNLYEEGVYDAFSRLERLTPCRVLHSRRDFLNILDDNRLDGGAVAVMADDASQGRIVSMAFAVSTGDSVRVTDVIGETHEARMAALRQIRGSFADMPFKVSTLPCDNSGSASRRPLIPRGMLRIVSVRRCLQAVAAANPCWRCRLRISDPVVADNNHTFIVDSDGVTIDDAFTGDLDFDIPVNVLADIAFSSPRIGEVMSFPSVRPEMTLMLD